MNLSVPQAAGAPWGMIAAESNGAGTPGWLIAIIGVAGVVIGGLITLWGNQLSAAREERKRTQDHVWEERKRSQDRLWEARSRLYEAIVVWIGKTEQALHDLHYSYTQYIQSPPPAAGEAPRVRLKKQLEYRQIIPLDDGQFLNRLEIKRSLC